MEIDFPLGAGVRRRVRRILWFCFFCAFFILPLTPAYQIADALLLAFLVISLIVATVMKLRKLWKYRSDPEMLEAHISSGQGGLWGRRWQRWALDDYDEGRDSK